LHRGGKEKGGQYRLDAQRLRLRLYVKRDIPSNSRMVTGLFSRD
jgi:hypothetical protein